MITRYYICDACEYSFSIKQELHDEKRLKKCPECKKNKLYQDLSGQHTFVKQEPKTLGHLAAKKADEAGKYELQEKQREIKKQQDAPKLSRLKRAGLVKQDAEVLPETPKPFWNPEGKDPKKELKDIIGDKKKTAKYILTGEK